MSKRLVIRNNDHCGKIKLSILDENGIMQLKSTNSQSNTCVYIDRQKAELIISHLQEQFKIK